MSGLPAGCNQVCSMSPDMQATHQHDQVQHFVCLSAAHPYAPFCVAPPPPGSCCNSWLWCAGTFLPPLSWPLIASCIWLALLYLQPRLSATDKRQAFAGLSAAALLLVFLLQDTEFSGWGE